MEIKEVDTVAKQKSPAELVKPAKLKKQHNKRKASAIDSCVRTDLLCLARPKKISKNQTANTAAASYAACGTKVPQENRAQAALVNPEKARPASTAVLT